MFSLMPLPKFTCGYPVGTKLGEFSLQHAGFFLALLHRKLTYKLIYTIIFVSVFPSGLSGDFDLEFRLVLSGPMILVCLSFSL